MRPAPHRGRVRETSLQGHGLRARMNENLSLRAWGRSMLLEFAAKQQIVPLTHMFTDAITPLDEQQLGALVRTARALETGKADWDGFHRLLHFNGGLEGAAALLGHAAGPLTAEEAGMALAFAYVPFEVADAFAVNVVTGASLKRLARAIDPLACLPTRTRLFVADSLMRDESMRGLVACTASVAALRHNALNGKGTAAAAAYARGRLRRLAAAAAGLHQAPSLMAEALRCCSTSDWWNAQGVMRHIAADAGVRTGEDFRNPPALADLLAISLMPTCDTIDAIERLLRARESVAGVAR
ncbi:MAG: hypothetical protein ACK4UO_05675 [Pseudolabrys sp.]